MLSPLFSRLSSHSRPLLLIVLVVLLLTLAIRWSLGELLELTFDPQYWLRDYLGNLVVAVFFYTLTQSLWRALVLGAVFLIGFQSANAGKLVVLGTPISPDDFANLQNLFLLWEGWMLVAMVAIVSVPAVLLLALVSWRSTLTWVSLAVVAGTAAASVHFSRELQPLLDERFGNSVWNQPENFYRRGLGLHIAQEAIRTLAKVGDMPSLNDVQAVQDDVVIAKVDTQALDRRNVHMVLLETFFDPQSLGESWVPDDPLPEDFRALWDATGNTTTLSPVFGGYTANAEFEALCGFPVTEHAVFFEGWLRRIVPCLPALLREAGYKTVASHPNVAGFWNRTHAYRLSGFDTYWSKSDFDLTESADNFLFDHSYYDQVFDLLEPLGEQPIFNYMVTIYGHLPYPSAPGYPDQVDVAEGRDTGLLQGYLNHVYYKSRDLMAMLDELRAEDPDALIILFGDHLPYLGPNYAVFDEFLGLPDDRSAFTGEMFEFLISTPLIVIDGQRGPLDLGQLPLYRLPALILELLGSDAGGITDWTKNPDYMLIRPVYGMHFTINEDGQRVVCPPENSEQPECVQSSEWRARTRTLSADIFSGEQHSLEWLNR